MPDFIDDAQDNVLAEGESFIRKARSLAAAIPNGAPGYCLNCGTYSGRIVTGRCAPCRDGEE